MQSCLQTEGQTIYEHGLAVWAQFQRLLFGTTEGMRLPAWYTQYREQILEEAYAPEILCRYAIFHDCGKPYILTFDDQGRRHFPDHAEQSWWTWTDHFGTEGDNGIIADLIRYDMICHTESFETIKARDLDRRLLCSLLLSALAEIHANASMFGGIESTSFKIKAKRLDKLGMKLVTVLFS